MTSFAEAIRTRDFVVTAGLALPAPATPADIRKRVDVLKPFVDAVQIEEDRAADGTVDPLAAASLVLAEGIDAVLQLSCRDRNRLALRGQLLGAAALGVSSVLLSRGTKLPERLRGRVKGVFDTSATQLLALARQANEELQSTGGRLFVGAFAPVIRPKPGWQAERIAEKIEAGTSFVQTRPCLNRSMLAEYMARLVALKVPRRVSVLVDVPFLRSPDDLQRLRDEHPGLRVPAGVAKRIFSARDPEVEAVTVCAEVLAALRDMPGVSGANLAGFPDPALAAAAIEQSRAP